VERLVVWGRADGGVSEESFWLEWRPPELEVLGKRNGALIVADGGVYRFQETTGIGHGLKDCAPAFDPSAAPIPNNQFTIEVKGASAKRLDAEGDIVVSEPDSVEDASSYDNSVVLEASIGSSLFVTEHADFLYCTANHQAWTNAHFRFDLAQRERARFPTKDDEEALRSAARQVSPELLKPCLDISVGDASEVPSLAALYLDSSIPRWSKPRGFYSELGFGIMRTYVEGLKTCWLEVSALPPSLGDVRVPAAFAELPRRLPGFTVLGWSLVPVDARAAVERSFLRRVKR
jgi:hypothetical protein